MRLGKDYVSQSHGFSYSLRYKDLTLGTELKVWRDKKGDSKTDGINQLDASLAGLGLGEGWLLVFDCRTNTLPFVERPSSEVVQSPQK